MADSRSVRELALLLAVVLGALALFIDKAFTIDDPLFLWLAEHLQADPLDFYGFEVNWYGTGVEMYKVTKNPPLAGYFIAAAAAVLGWSERALHAAFLLPAAGATVFTWLLARRLCDRPLEASLIGLLTPVFLISSTNVMCDTTMLAFWMGALVCFSEGLDRSRWTWLMAAALLTTLAALTKYFGAALVPLLAAYALARTRRIGAWAIWLLVPLAILAGFDLLTRSLYGVGLLVDAAAYANQLARAEGDFLRQALLGLVFAGGCCIPTLVYAPRIFPAPALAVAAMAFFGGVFLAKQVVALVGIQAGSASPTLLAVELLTFGLGGLALAFLAGAELGRSRDPDAWLLALWVLGTLAFAMFFNWTNNGRSNLPLAPAVGILIARRLSASEISGASRRLLFRARPLAISAAIALVTTWSDTRWANEVRAAASDLTSRYGAREPTLWFAGHWGFQYYMERGGATALDFRRTIEAGDLLVVPSNNTPFETAPLSHAVLLETVSRPEPSWLRTVSPALAAGFYDSDIGPLPFGFGTGATDLYRVFRTRRALEFELELEAQPAGS